MSAQPSFHEQPVGAPGVSGCRRGIVLTLTGDLSVATRITKSAKMCHLEVRHLDRSERLIEALKSILGAPVLVIDWDTREADGFKALKAIRETVDLKKAAVVGFVSAAKQETKREAEGLGCLRVYGKSEFFSGLEMIWVRYVK